MAMEVDLLMTEEERVVDPRLGYPPGYAKLCRHASAHLHGLVTPFSQGPPHRFLPYSPQSQDFATLKEWDGLFPTVVDTDRDHPQNARKHAEELWQQLDHLGNAGFDPAKFRVDPYGNVVYWNADASSPLAWEIDHWFPHSRGGKTVVTNLRVVQWQACQRMKNRLEFLVPWWDLQHGCSINQFLSAFASKNADFRKRSFALFFSGGEDESVAREHVGECRPWPQQFREKKAHCGLAAAAIVMVHKENVDDVPLKPLLACDVPPASGMQVKRRWSAEEEEALRRAVTKFGSGRWKEVKESEPALANRSTVQLKEKYRLMRVNSGKENMLLASTVNCKSDHLDRRSSATTTLQKELRMKIMREEEKREKEVEIAELEKTVMNLKQQNEKERVHAVELEAVLTKHKRRVEKQRRWAETQSSYRLCLERMIRDTMHQSISYKEQARLNQAACNALKARLDCQKAACEAAEKNLLQQYSQRGILEGEIHVGELSGCNVNSTKNNLGGGTMQGRDIVDVSSCVCFPDGDEDQVDKKVLLQDINLIDTSDSEDETADEVYSRRTEHRRRKDLLHQEHQQEEHVQRMSIDLSCQHQVQLVSTLADVGSEVEASQVCTAKTELLGGMDLQDICDHVQCPESHEAGGDIHVPSAGVNELSELRQVQKNVIVVQSENNSNADVTPDTVEKGVVHKEEYLDELLQHVRFGEFPSLEAAVEDSPLRKSEEHLDELLQQVLATHLERIRKTEAGRQQAASDTDDEKLRQIGKQNLDKWLQVLLFNVESAGSSPGQASPLHRAFSPAFTQMSIAAMRAGNLHLEANQDQELGKKTGESMERPKGLWGVLLRKLSARQQSEQCLSNKLDAESEDNEASKTSQGNIASCQEPDTTKTTIGNDASTVLRVDSSRALSDISGSLVSDQSTNTDPANGSPKSSALDQHFTVERRHYLPRALSDVDEVSETDSLTSTTTCDSRQLENRDPNRSGLRASIKAAGLVWKKAVKKLQDGPHPTPDMMTS